MARYFIFKFVSFIYEKEKICINFSFPLIVCVCLATII